MARCLPNRGLLDRLSGFLAERRGFSPQAIASSELARAAQRLLESGLNPEALAQQMDRGEPRVLHELCASVAVGETYFFRHAEHFEFLKKFWIPKVLDSRPGRLRVWSAGCATGEEAFSIAACLSSELGLHRDFSVLGTDLVEKSVQAAIQGEYGSWSLRKGSPLLYPVLERGRKAAFRVLEHCRQGVKFLCHDLLSGPPQGEGPFNLIFCRNVLVYFSPERAGRILEMLAGCLVPGGLLVLGSMDACPDSAGLQPCGHSGMQLFRRLPQAAAPKRREKAAVPAAEPRELPKPSVSAAAPLELHLKVLRHRERGEEEKAGRTLSEIAARHPDYLPGRLEWALWLRRQRREAEARAEMRCIAGACAGRDPQERVEGLMTVPLGYLLASAKAYLQNPGGGS